MAAAPFFDEVTQYSIEWCRDALNQIRPYIEITELMDWEAVRATVEQTLEEIQPQWFTHYDHGSDYAMWGDDEQKIIDLSNLDKLAGMRVYCMNCSSGKGLGAHAVDRGILEYLGYVDTVGFTSDALEEFKQALNYGLVKAITEGKNLKDVVEDMRENGYDIADRLRAEGKIFAAASLVKDMNILHVYYQGGPPPPKPSCSVSAGIAKAFGWDVLWFLRMLRQKLFPEDFKKACGVE